MANISIPKILFGIIYFLIPPLIWFVPSVGEMLPEAWMGAAVVALMFVFGLSFVLAQSGKLMRFFAVLLIILSMVYAGYREFPSLQTDFAQVDADYEAETGTFYTAEETAFQVKQQVVAAHVVSALPAFFSAAWCATGILILALGARGMKEVFAYAAIPSNQSSRGLDSNAEITDDIAAATNRPSAEQRAAALASLRAAQASSAPASEDEAQPAAAPKIKISTPEKAPAQSSSAQSPFTMPSFTDSAAFTGQNGAAAYTGETGSTPEPIIKMPETNTLTPSSSMDASYSRRNTDSPVTASGKVNIKLDLGEDPEIRVENTAVFRSADGTTSYYQETQPENADPFAELKQEINPFAAMGSPFSQKTADVPVAEAVPAPEPASAAAPVPDKAEKPRMSEEEKQRIKKLNSQVADLKTLYNQGMISQDEYISQRTELLREMYNSEK